MTSWRFILESLRHHWRINLAVALGVMAATAVLTGALLVGDSVRGSLLSLAFDRLGDIDEVLLADRFFREQLADELEQADGFKERFTSATPVIIFPSGTVERKTDDTTNRASNVLIVGGGKRFWSLGNEAARPRQLPGRDEIVLNEPLASDLGISANDLKSTEEVLVTLRIPNDQALAADFAVGKKEGLVSSLPRLKVIDIVPAQSLGRFSLHASQSVPRNAFVSMESLQHAIDQRGKVNTILVAGKTEKSWKREDSSTVLAGMFQPTFEDYGFVMKRAKLMYKESDEQQEDVIYDYFSFSSERMVLDDHTVGVAEESFQADRGQPVFTYLANAIGLKKNPDDAVPFSMVTAIDFSDQFAPKSSTTSEPIGQLADDEIVLNSWTQQDLDAKVGDKIIIEFFEPETAHGEEVKREAQFILKDVVELIEPAKPFELNRAPVFEERPTLVNDPDLTPFVPGVTDQESIEDWDLPFETPGIKGEDDQYWRHHRTTPKAFISLKAGRKLWQSRFGETTSYRIPARGVKEDELKEKFLQQARLDGVTFGFEFRPVKRQGWKSSSGTTPFDALFLGLSLFIIVAALMLVSLLFRLGIEQRANEVGILMAVGLKRSLMSRMLVAEGSIVAAVGGLMGVLLGAGYSWLMLVGLNTLWRGAIVTPFLQYHWTLKSVVVGYVSGVLVSIVTIAWSLRQTRDLSVRQLLSGQGAETSELVKQRSRWPSVVAIILLVVAVGLVASATSLGGEAQAGAFVGGGTMLLTAILVLTWSFLRHDGGRSAATRKIGLAQLAAKSAGRNPSRSTITIGLVAFASFLIAAMSCFRLAPTAEGTAGFSLIGQSNRPIFADLNTQQGRDELLADDAESLPLRNVLSMRLRPGDDASCNNLYQSVQPRVLGVSRSMIEYFENPDVQKFSFASSDARAESEKNNPWRLLRSTDRSDEAIPVVLDKNTAMYSLKLYWGIGEEFEREFDGRSIRFRVVGLLANSVLQGSLLIGEDDFESLFRNTSGYRYFLLKADEAHLTQVSQVLEDRFGDQGFDAVSSIGVLEQLLAVQNTYLSTFQSLGALGLLLGTFGLATVQLRSVFERRKELALMRAAGFRRTRLAQMVMLENAVLLLGGLLTGVVAALVAVIPHMIFGSASIPFADLAIMFVVILGVGLISGFAAVRATLKAPLLSGLRGE